MTIASQHYAKSSKHAPCPVCGRVKDGDCRWNSEIVLCHSYVDQDAGVPGYTYRGSTIDNLWGQYFPAAEPLSKPARPKSRHEYFYPDRNGQHLIKVTRVDDGNGGKQFYQSHWNGGAWVKGLTAEIKRQVAIYRFQEVTAAIAAGQPIIWVEGESCADSLWRLGIPATTSIGGAKGYRCYGSYTGDLKGAQLVLAPDRDQTGLAYAEEVAKDFLDAQWLYPFPDSPVWNRLPQSGGLDVGDWIAGGATAEVIRSAVGDKRNLGIDHSSAQPEDPDTRLRLALLELLGTTDFIKRLRKRAEICSHYRLSKTEVEEALGQLRRRTQTPEPSCFGLDEFLSQESPGLEYLIEGLLPVGETALLTADPKAGKTLLAFDAAYAIATGESDFLGETVRQGRVLIISADESASSTRAKLYRRGFRHEDAPNVRVMPRFDLSQLDELETQLEAFRPSLVVIDSLRRINCGRDIGENSAEFADSIYALKELLSRYRASGLLIHHANKSRDALGVSRIRGTSAIAGSVWGLWQLDHIPKQDPKNKKRQVIDPKDPARILTITPRDAEGQTLKLQLDLENNHWLNHGEEGDSAESLAERKTQQQAILDLLAEAAPKGLTGREIALYRGGIKSIYSVLDRMVGKRLITKRPSTTDRRSMVYALPEQTEDSPPSLPPTECVKNVIYSSETNTQQGFEDRSQNRSQIDHTSITSLGEKDPVINSKPDVASSSEIDHIVASQRGERVSSDVCDQSKKGGSITVGSTVHKRHKSGWTGRVVTLLDEDTVDVLWRGDKYPSSVKLSELRLKEVGRD